MTLPVAVAGLLVGLLVPRGFIHLLGIDTQQSDNYDFVSGVGPMIIALLGFSSLFASILHSVNCHEDGCWRIGRHKVGGTPWCNRHHEHARPEQTENQILQQILTEVSLLRDMLRNKP